MATLIEGSIIPLRVLVMISISSSLAWTFGRDLLWSEFDETLKLISRADGLNGKLPVFEHEYILWLSLSAIAYIGIWINKKWGFLLLAITNLASVILAPFYGVMVEFPFERFLFSLLSLSDGLMIGIGVAILLERKRAPCNHTP